MHLSTTTPRALPKMRKWRKMDKVSDAGYIQLISSNNAMTNVRIAHCSRDLADRPIFLLLD